MTVTNSRNGHTKTAKDDPQATRLPSFTTQSRAGVSDRRRWARVIAGFVAVVLGAWIFAVVYRSANDRTSVLEIAQPVARSATISREDLRVVEVGTSGGLATVPADQLHAIVGRVAATDLPAGSLLTPAGLESPGTKVFGRDEAVVGVLVARNEAPSSELRRGARVSVVVRGASGTDDPPQVIDGLVFDASADSLSDGTRPIELVVARDDAAIVASAAADKRVSVAVFGG